MTVFISTYSVVDGFFISNFAGDIPFKAVNLIMPYIMIVSTVGFMFGAGGTAIVANTLGKGDSENANKYFSLFVYVTFIIGLVLAIISVVFLRTIASLLGAEGQILENCVLYGRILLCALPFAVLQFLFQSFCVAAEKPRFGFAVILAAGITNIVLDALLVMLLPQAYKLAGAATASAVSYIVGGGIPVIYFSRKNHSLLHLGKATFNGKVIIKACLNGSSEFMSNAAMSLVGMLYNIQLLKYAGSDGVAAYGATMYISLIFAAVFVGFSMSTSPIISYNDGAANHDEKKSVLKKSLVIIAVGNLLIFAASELFAVPLSQIFVSYSDVLMEMTVRGLRICAASFLFMGFSIFVSSFFTALNDGLTSALISFLRTLVFQLGAVLLLPLVWRTDGIWISVIVAELMSVILSFVFLLAKKKQFHY